MKQPSKSLHLLLVAALFGSVGAAAANERAVLYTTNNDSAVQAVLDSARQQTPALEVGVVTGSSAALLKRIEAEGDSARADVFWSSQPNTLGAFTSLYQPYRSPQADAIELLAGKPQPLWSAANIQVVVLMLNRKQLKDLPAPTQWRDLLDPAWRGRIIVGDPTATSTAYTVLWACGNCSGRPTSRRWRPTWWFRVTPARCSTRWPRASTPSASPSRATPMPTWPAASGKFS